MSDDSQDKKKTVPDVLSAKSYSTDGATAEFDPGALQVHAISSELRQEMAGTELPRLDPKYLQDTAPPNRGVGAFAGASALAAATQPSLRRIQRAPPGTNWRRRSLHGLLILLSLALLWEVAALVRASFGAHEESRPEPRDSVPISPGARPRGVETTEPAAGLKTEPVSGLASAPRLPTSTSPQAQAASLPPPASPAAERASAARNSSSAASLPRAPALLPELVRQEASVPPKLEGAEPPEPAASSKSSSKVLFPPQ